MDSFEYNYNIASSAPVREFCTKGQNQVNLTDSASIFSVPEKDDLKQNDIDTLKQELNEVEDKQGFLGKLWNGFKNLTGLGTSSNDIEEKIKQYENGEISYEEAENSIKEFDQKQTGMVDMATSIVSGLVVAGSAVVTGGTSLIASAAIGGITKAGLKTLDRATNETEGDEFNLKQIGKDVLTGSVDGVITTATAGIGSAVKTGAGVTVKEAVKSGAIQGAKQGVISGAVMGATNYTAEAVFEEDVEFSVDGLLQTAAQGAAIGGVMGGVLGGVTNGIKQAKINKTEAATVVKSETNINKTGDEAHSSSVEEKTPVNSNQVSNEAEINSSNPEGKTLKNSTEEGTLGITKKTKNGIINDSSAPEGQSASVGNIEEPAIKFTPEERAQMIEDSNFASWHKSKLNKLNDEQLSTALKLKKSGFNDDDILILSKNMKKEHIEFAIKLKEAGFSDFSSISDAQYIKSAEQIEIAKALKDAGFSEFTSTCNSADISLNDVSTAIKLKEAGFTDLSSIENASYINPDNVDIAVYFKNLGIEDESSILLSGGNLEYSAYKNIQDDIQNGYTISVRKNQQTGMAEAVSYKCQQDSEFGSFIGIEKKYTQNGDIIYSRTQHQMPTVEIKEGNYYINGLDSHISANDANITPEITISEYGNWKINGQNADIMATSSSRTNYAGSSTTAIIDYDSNSITRNIDDMFETKLAPDGKIEIIQTKKSDILDGSYEVTKYTEKDFQGFSQDTDIVSEIKKGNVQGQKLSTVTKNSDGSITLNENFERNGSNITRNYTQSETGSEYSYHITDENGNSILKLDRSFSKNPDGTTTTVINGKKYITSFNDADKTITITNNNGEKTVINIANKMKDSSSEDINKFFEFSKTIPSDQLETLGKNASIIELRDVLESGMNEDHLLIGENNFVLSHELGHSKDFLPETGPSLSNNPELKAIYTNEMNKFNAQYTSETQNIIDYFGFNGGAFINDGLSEFLAESNALCTTYGISGINEITTRSQFIVKYFPKTFSKIASLLGYNAI